MTVGKAVREAEYSAMKVMERHFQFREALKRKRSHLESKQVSISSPG
jgi:hypothetical protein